MIACTVAVLLAEVIVGAAVLVVLVCWLTRRWS
jgi:hypothetical protein